MINQKTYKNRTEYATQIKNKFTSYSIPKTGLINAALYPATRVGLEILSIPIFLVALSKVKYSEQNKGYILRTLDLIWDIDQEQD